MYHNWKYSFCIGPSPLSVSTSLSFSSTNVLHQLKFLVPWHARDSDRRKMLGLCPGFAAEVPGRAGKTQDAPNLNF
jgi:hypothetical protein